MAAHYICSLCFNFVWGLSVEDKKLLFYEAHLNWESDLRNQNPESGNPTYSTRKLQNKIRLR